MKNRRGKIKNQSIHASKSDRRQSDIDSELESRISLIFMEIFAKTIYLQYVLSTGPIWYQQLLYAIIIL